ncbi:Peptidoglycan-binding domain 1 protein [Actinobacteria bacterium OK074]|nr:Peptidoglycan-binding domain 1 protein [Actinobacteria bacterium OK074]
MLSEGDKGAEVKELQLRLKQVFFYFDDADGNYDSGVAQAVANYQTARGISGDEQGVYGAATRARLESETTDP